MQSKSFKKKTKNMQSKDLMLLKFIGMTIKYTQMLAITPHMLI